MATFAPTAPAAKRPATPTAAPLSAVLNAPPVPAAARVNADSVVVAASEPAPPSSRSMVPLIPFAEGTREMYAVASSVATLTPPLAHLLESFDHLRGHDPSVPGRLDRLRHRATLLRVGGRPQPQLADVKHAGEKLFGDAPFGLVANLRTVDGGVRWQVPEQRPEQPRWQPRAIQLGPQIEPVETQQVGLDRPPELV